MEHIEIEGLDIGYQRVGEGPALVLLHGAFGFDGSSWEPQIDDLSDEFMVVAWDMPGCGQSADPPESFTWRDYGRVLVRFIAALDLGRPHILGLSFGSMLALELYRQRPDLPRSLILAGAYAGWAGSLPPDAVAQRKEAVARALDLPPAAWARQWSSSMLSPSAPAALKDQVETMIAQFRPVGQRRLFHAVADEDLRDVLPAIAVPTLLIYGENDTRSPLGVADMLHTSIHHSQLVVLPGAGHVCNLEEPAQFNSAVRRFLHSAEP